jgi:hypothetical protein
MKARSSPSVTVVLPQPLLVPAMTNACFAAAAMVALSLFRQSTDVSTYAHPEAARI